MSYCSVDTKLRLVQSNNPKRSFKVKLINIHWWELSIDLKVKSAFKVKLIVFNIHWWELSIDLKVKSAKVFC
ncbi:unnamed protein product [Lactuca virosa]|uniref:Uncharacterized protein n=1 Tax=Lactuca virosa TaxID=75947 RepID=A0AAU9NN57_9ASTR|nr:unnamed protein product [Lactuca virosa]